MRNKPSKILVEEACRTSRLVEKLRRNLPAAQFEVVETISDSPLRDPRRLEVVQFRGRFLKSCPGTRHYFCCGYQILHFGVQCSLNCTYCILQAYLNHPNLRIFGNQEDLFRELRQELATHRERLYRIGTGEFTDSLLVDPWTEFSRDLVPFFAKQPNAVLELKTKTDFIDNLRDLDHRGHTLAAWSLNAAPIRRREETAATTIKQRLAAAKKVAQWGYKLAFHFDPMIEYPGWREGYREVLDRLFSSVDTSRIVWISLGAFRFMPELKPIIQRRHPGSTVIYGEFIRGLDGKLRYFRDIRVELYAWMVDRIREVDAHICVYLCMEGEDIWQQVFGFSPQERGGLPAMLDKAVETRMGIAPR
ncbi:SPL family radical SAM protein [Desulfoferrobacter suflitae]|uniref:SPL family radical SAM protein n=1 Tax=Desulfoferrobacter suflitae TaxID=2865782 RepID=UPI0021640A48|nr:DNA photolyase [Desulfoferrobacter suflitae]MCK8603991.1 DNA photolyase [Desulfoferrobacter suflitae]